MVNAGGSPSAAAVVSAVVEQLRSRERPGLRVASALAVEAARSYSERTATPLPPALALTQPNPHLRPAFDEQRRWLDQVDDGVVADYLPTLMYRLGAEQGGEHLSSPSIVRVALVSALARLRPGTQEPLTVLDVAVGSGAMLGALATAVAARGITPHVLGQELNPDLAGIAAATLYLQGRSADIRVADSLTEDPFPTEGVDLAVSQPPFGLSWQRQEQQVRERQRAEGWYPFGLPSKNDATWLFASRMLEKLRPRESGGGRAVVFSALGALTGHAVDSLRRAILTEDLLEAVVALPGGLSPSTSIQLYALIFANNKTGPRVGKVQVINLRPYFETSRDRRSTQRDLQHDAFEVLGSALASVRDGMASRTLPVEYFLRRRVSVTAARPQGSASNGSTGLAWDVEIPLHQDPDQFLRERYGSQLQLSWEARDQPRAPLETDSIFDSGRQQLLRWIQQQGWESTRLSALLMSSPGLPKPVEATGSKPLLMLPTGSQPAYVAPQQREERGRVLALELAPTVMSPDFLASWLNTSRGRESRRRAHDFASSGAVIVAVRTDERSLLRFADEMIVPLPPLQVQQELAAAEARLGAVLSLTERARRDMWDSPVRSRQVVSQFDSLFDESLGTWTAELPYPVASALWTLETRSTLDARHKQMFLVWEAYAAFTGTVLLSALAQDPALREAEMPPLRSALASAAVSMERATLGAWNVITQRLSARFRDLLASDDLDERARVLQVFGSPSHDTLTRLLSPRVVQLLSDANAKRNEWAGHAGAAGDRELNDQLGYLTARLEELRDEVGSAWRELQCVRAGEGWRSHGQIHQKVEVAMGTSTPFRQSELRVGELMDRGDLYLATDGCAQPLPLQHLLVLRQSPDSARYAAYFYNRMQGEKVRIVSYHLAERSDVTEEMADVADAVHDLLGAGLTDTSAD